MAYQAYRGGSNGEYGGGYGAAYSPQVGTPGAQGRGHDQDEYFHASSGGGHDGNGQDSYGGNGHRGGAYERHDQGGYYNGNNGGSYGGYAQEGGYDGSAGHGYDQPEESHHGNYESISPQYENGPGPELNGYNDDHNVQHSRTDSERQRRPGGPQQGSFSQSYRPEERRNDGYKNGGYHRQSMYGI